MSRPTAVVGNSTGRQWISRGLATTRAERIQLLSIIVMLPLQDHIPSVFGFSSLFLMYGILAVYVVLFRLPVLEKVCMHPVFTSAIVFVGVSALLEFCSPLSSYADLYRFAQMVGGAVIIACLCRDREALTVCMYAYLVAGLWVGLVILITSFGALHGASASDFYEASALRVEAFRDTPISSNLNGLAFICAQGGIVGIALALSTTATEHRRLFIGIANFCLMASILTMSRGAIVIIMLTLVMILFASGVKHGRAIIIIVMILSTLIAVVPDVVWSRFSFSTQMREGAIESRAALYMNALEHMPEYIGLGVGAGNYWHAWGFEKGFASGSAFSLDVGGVHNSFLQVVINWGIPGLLGFLTFIAMAYRCIPQRSGGDPITLSLLGISMSLLAMLCFTHTFYDKIFALGLGLLVAISHWGGPKAVAIVPAVHKRRFDTTNA